MIMTASAPISPTWLLLALLAASLPAPAQEHADHRHESSVERADNQGEREVAYWVAPMDSSYRRDEPGQSPMGMDLVPVYVDELAESGQVRIGPSVRQAMNLRTFSARRDRLWRRIDTVGRVQVDESAIHHVHPRVSGWIQAVDIASEGDTIRAGQRLFTLYAPDLVNAQEEFLQALRSGRAAQIESARERLLTLGVQSEFVDRLAETREVVSDIPWFARHDGVVTALGARHGMFVEPGETIIEMVDLSSVWVIADVFPRHANWLAQGQPVEIRTPFRPGRTFEARVDYVYPLLDTDTRTVRARIPVDNPDGLLKPGMWADARIFAGPVEDRLIIPREALIRTGQSERVVLRVEDDLFKIRNVVSGMESGDYVAIVEGLEAGEVVVTSGQFLIDSEASQNAGEQRLGGHHDH
jgi:membrane fusion protein, copper/silver efflux system